VCGAPYLGRGRKERTTRVHQVNNPPERKKKLGTLVGKPRLSEELEFPSKPYAKLYLIAQKKNLLGTEDKLRKALSSWEKIRLEQEKEG